jgi:hypothetical protein
LLLTEATVEGFDPARLQDWANAKRYGRQIIDDVNAGAVGWTDWNILLDERGGPNHVGNFCFAPVHADVASGQLTFTPSFAYLGQFSKFMRPGAPHQRRQQPQRSADHCFQEPRRHSRGDDHEQRQRTRTLSPAHRHRRSRPGDSGAGHPDRHRLSGGPQRLQSLSSFKATSLSTRYPRSGRGRK